MRTHGRVNWLILVGVVVCALIAGLFLMGRNSPTSVAGDFMVALAEGNSEKLTDMTYMDGVPKEEIRKKWDFATKEAGPHYRFIWLLGSESISGPDHASVSMKMVRNAGTDPMTYEEKFELPMVKVKGTWLVDVAAIQRDMYPALPRRH